VRILVFSGIHNDLSTRRRLIETDADYYVAAGDPVSHLRARQEITVPDWQARWQAIRLPSRKQP